jgi:hypothetical protein
MPQEFNPEIAMRGILCVALVVGLIVICLFLATLRNALERVSPHNRLLEPGLVWVCLIPCLNLFWQFVVYTRVPASLAKEFQERGQHDGSNYGKGIGLALAVINVLSVCGSPFGGWDAGPDEALLMNYGSIFLGLGGLILFIIFWVKIANYSALLVRDGSPPPDWRRKLDQFDDDDRGPRLPAPGPPDESYKEQDRGRYQ